METAKEIAKKSKSSFYYAFNLLPEQKREAMNTVYAFCRQTDDLVDEGSEPDEIKYENLIRWKRELENGLKGKSNYFLLNNLSKIIKQFNIPLDPFFDLISGMEQDLLKKRYQNFDDLKDYLYKAASTVGLMCIEIFGYKNKSAKDFAINLGYALQLTNILRDVKKDSKENRIYLPKDDMVNFKYSENDIFNSNYNNNFTSLMEFEASRAKEFFIKANQSLDFDDKPAMFAARAMQHIYFKLLKKLETEAFNVFDKKINVSTFEKASIAIGVWAKYRLVY